MNVSSRWCVTAFFALGALSCSDPVPPPAQGAFIATVGPVSPQPAGKSCPSPSFTYDVPSVRIKDQADVLTGSRYNNHIIDGEKGGSVACSVKGSAAGFTFSGSISSGGRGLSISNGTIGADKTGTATITVTNTESLSPPQLVSAPASCTITATGENLQVAAGNVWAKFKCSAVERMPSSSCGAEGYFVFENCEK